MGRQLDLIYVAEVLGLEAPSSSAAKRPLTSISTDSRSLPPGSLFVAIKGEIFDGHDFIGAAIKAGAIGVICNKGRAPAEHHQAVIFEVKDSLLAYRHLSSKWRNEFAIPIVAVAGSVGKTTAKEFLAAILQGKWQKVLKTEGSQNGFVGIPMTLMKLRSEHQAAVIEVGIDDMGAMENHMRLLNPGAALVTAIAEEHLHQLKNIETVTTEELFCLDRVQDQDGIVAVNLDDKQIYPYIAKYKGALFFSLQDPPPEIPKTLEGRLISGNYKDRTLVVEGLEDGVLTLKVPLPGKHNAENLMGAIAIAAGLGLKNDQIKTGLDKFEPPPGRNQIQTLSSGVTVLCDHYNASPSSMVAALNTLEELWTSAGERGQKRICLGDMLELGDESEAFHRGIAQKIITSMISEVLLYGTMMKSLVDELGIRKFSGRIQHFDDHSKIAEALNKSLKPNDHLLIKGSRGMKMEKVFSLLSSSGT